MYGVETLATVFVDVADSSHGIVVRAVVFVVESALFL